MTLAQQCTDPLSVKPYFHAKDHGEAENMTMCWDVLNCTDDETTDGMLANHAGISRPN